MQEKLWYLIIWVTQLSNLLATVLFYTISPIVHLISTPFTLISVLFCRINYMFSLGKPHLMPQSKRLYLVGTHTLNKSKCTVQVSWQLFMNDPFAQLSPIPQIHDQISRFYYRFLLRFQDIAAFLVLRCWTILHWTTMWRATSSSEYFQVGARAISGI